MRFYGGKKSPCEKAEAGIESGFLKVLSKVLKVGKEQATERNFVGKEKST